MPPAGGAPRGEAVGERLSAAAADVRFRSRAGGWCRAWGSAPRCTGWPRRSARRLGCNTPEGVVVEVEGAEAAVGRFIAACGGAPAARAPGRREVESVPALAESRVPRSWPRPRGGGSGPSCPPTRPCAPDCRAEMEDPADRRFHYPFTTCTNCGPRFSLVQALPYDRERTSMACFPLCPECQREYTDPTDRRFHAEPVCCPACGPRMWVVRPWPVARGPWPRNAEASLKLWAGGGARRGAGGSGAGGDRGGQGAGRVPARLPGRRRGRGEAAAVERKRRPSKPFAVMVRNSRSARRLVVLTGPEEAELASVRAPIVLAPPGGTLPLVAEAVAPGLGDLGVLLPTTPLHVELFRDAAVRCPGHDLGQRSGRADLPRQPGGGRTAGRDRRLLPAPRPGRGAARRRLGGA